MPKAPMKFTPTAVPDAAKIHGIFGGSMVTIFVGPESTRKKYVLPKDMLCRKSPYFRAHFESGFFESREGILHLPDVDPGAFDMVVQLVCIGRAIPPTRLRGGGTDAVYLQIRQRIAQMIEFHLLTDRFQLPRIPSHATDIQEIMYHLRQDRDVLTAAHIRAAVNLPDGHIIRQLFAKATLKDLVLKGVEPGTAFSFRAELYELPGFATDLLQAYLKVLRHSAATFIDPLDGSSFKLR